MLTLPVALTAPALFVAGVTTSMHCALMCGAINAAQMRSQGPLPLGQTLALVHGGRVLGYALLGAIAGLVGARLALWLPPAFAGLGLQLFAALVLIAAGAQQWINRRPVVATSVGSKHACGKFWRRPATTRSVLPPRGQLAAQGLAWALLPCGILYSVLLLASLTASPVAGFVLLGGVWSVIAIVSPQDFQAPWLCAQVR